MSRQLTRLHWDTDDRAQHSALLHQCNISSVISWLHITIFCRQHWATLRRDYEAVRSVALSARGGIWFGQKLPPSAFVTCPLSSSLLILPCLPRTWYPWLKTWKTRETKTPLYMSFPKVCNCNMWRITMKCAMQGYSLSAHFWTNKIVSLR